MHLFSLPRIQKKIIMISEFEVYLDLWLYIEIIIIDSVSDH